MAVKLGLVAASSLAGCAKSSPAVPSSKISWSEPGGIVEIVTPRGIDASARKTAVVLRLELETRFPFVAASVELLPMPCWGRNVRSRLRSVVWELIRQDALEKSGVRSPESGVRSPVRWMLPAQAALESGLP